VGLLLYDCSTSSNALKVRFALAELGLRYERVPVPIARPRPSWYLERNPIGLIPSLSDDGWLLSESHAILRYLAAREGREDLYPVDLADRARVDEFLDRFATFFRPAFHRHEIPALGWTVNGGLRSRDPDEAEAARAAEAIAPVLQTLDDFVVAEGTVLRRFTIADCAIAPVLNRTRHTGLDHTPFPSLLALREALLARPAWAAAEPVL
jgi:glutathione S-transferase